MNVRSALLIRLLTVFLVTGIFGAGLLHFSPRHSVQRTDVRTVTHSIRSNLPLGSSVAEVKRYLESERSTGSRPWDTTPLDARTKTLHASLDLP